MFRSPRPPLRAPRPRRRAAALLTGLALTASALAGAAAGPAAAAGTAFAPVPAGAPARPAAPASPDPALTATALTSGTGALNNPDKGLVTYYSAGADENSTSVYPHSMQWSYFALNQVMTNASNCNSYDWSAVDSVLNEVASYGNTAAIRFYLVYPSGSPADGIPSCFTGHVSTRTDSYNSVTDPDYDSPFLINALGKFVSAFAARYDGDPRIGFIQMGLVGNWGENHTWPYNGDPGSGGYPNYMPTNSDFAEIVDDFANDFHRTQVEVRYPYTAGGAASGLNIGYHDDSFCALEGSPLQGVTLPESLGGASWSQLQLDLNQGTENKWITDSMGGEVYPPIQANAFTDYPGGSTANDVDNMGECVGLTHATWMLDQGSQSTASTDTGTDAAVEAMGYNFTANDAYFKTTASGSAEVGVRITNNGVAPFYYPWTMSLGLENSSGQIVKTWNTPWDIRTIEPANIETYPDWKVSGSPGTIAYGYPQYFQTDVNLSGVAAGSYQWVLKVDNPLSSVSSSAKPLLFSNATQNANGWLGLGSVSVTAASAGTAPSAPAGLTATGTASTIGLSWSAPSGTTPAGYEILRDGTVIATTQSTSYTDANLPVSTTHSYTVEAYDAAGDTSAASSAVTGSTTNGQDTTAPSVPTNVAASNVTGDSATISWTQSSDDTGVAGYDVYRNGTFIGSTTFTSYSDIELAGSTAYKYTVKAYDPAGNVSAASSSASITTGASETTTAPGAPTALSSPSQAGSAIDLSWTAPTSTGIGVAGYDIYRNGTLVGTTTATEQGTGGSATPTIYTDTGLASGTTYTYTVKSFDAAGDTSAASSAITATTSTLSATAPSVPTGLAASSKTSSSISLSWSASTAGSGGSVAGYDIYRNGAKVGTSTSTSYTDSGLNASTSYSYTVDAYDSAGDTSAQTSALTASTTAASCTSCSPPSTPASLVAEQESASSVKVSWTASTAGSGGSVAGYDVYRNGTKVGTSTSTSYTDTGLSASTSYAYTVAAYDSAGDTSAQSSSVAASTTATGVTGYEAESASNTLGGTAATASCTTCSGGEKVGYLGEGGTLMFLNVSAASAGTYTMTVKYIDGDAGRSAVITVNGTPTTVAFTGTNDSNWTTVQSQTVSVNLKAGTNTIEFSNSSAYAPDIDQITLNASSGTSSAAVYEADASTNTLAGGAVVQACSTCLDGKAVGYIGEGGTLTFPNVTETAAGTYSLKVYYIDGDAGRSAVITVNGTATTVAFAGTNNSNWTTVQTQTVSVTLKAGTNTIEFSNPSAYAPDIDHIVV
jgi:chitodextrinase